MRAGHPGGARSEIFSYWETLKAEYGRFESFVRAPVLPELVRIQDDLRRYLCLRCAGFLEKLTFFTLRTFIEANSYGAVQEFAKSHFTQAPNLTAKAFVALLSRFGPEYELRVNAFLNTSARRDLLNNLLEIRNSVAHGDVGNSGRLNPAGYMQLCEELYDWMISEFFEASAGPAMSVEPITQGGLQSAATQ